MFFKMLKIIYFLKTNFFIINENDHIVSNIHNQYISMFLKKFLKIVWIHMVSNLAIID